VNRPVTIVGIVLLLIGVLVGYLWWGTPTRRLEKDLEDSRAATQAVQRQLEAAQTEVRKEGEKVRALEERLFAVESELARERSARAGRLGLGRK